MSSPSERQSLKLTALVLTGIMLLGAGAALCGPKIALSEEQWDFGKITAAYSVGHVFRLKNAGDEPLTIEQVLTSCGCTTTSLEEKTIAPGQEISLRLTFNPSVLTPGMTTEKTVTILSNDPQESTKMLSVKAGLSSQGVAGVGIEPKWIRVGKEEEKRAVWKKVVINNQLGEPIAVRILGTSGAATQARLAPTRIPSGGRAELKLLVDCKMLDFADPNQTSGGNSVTLAFTTERREERVTLPVAISGEEARLESGGEAHQRMGRN